MVKRRTRLNFGEKLRIVDEATELNRQGMNRVGIADLEGVDRNNLRVWKKNRGNLLEMKSRKLLSKKSRSTGRPSTLSHIKQDLNDWFKNQRQLDFDVDYAGLMMRAIQFDRNLEELAEPSDGRFYRRIRTLAKASGICTKLGTHKAQTNPEEIKEEAMNWMIFIVPLVHQPGLPKIYVINMDEMAVYGSQSNTSALRQFLFERVLALAIVVLWL